MKNSTIAKTIQLICFVFLTSTFAQKKPVQIKNLKGQDVSTDSINSFLHTRKGSEGSGGSRGKVFLKSILKSDLDKRFPQLRNA